MTNEQPQDLQPTEEDMASLAGKIDAFAATLTPAERIAFGQLLQGAAGADDDTQGHSLFVSLFAPQTLTNASPSPILSRQTLDDGAAAQAVRLLGNVGSK